MLALYRSANLSIAGLFAAAVGLAVLASPALALDRDRGHRGQHGHDGFRSRSNFSLGISINNGGYYRPPAYYRPRHFSGYSGGYCPPPVYIPRPTYYDPCPPRYYDPCPPQVVIVRPRHIVQYSQPPVVIVERAPERAPTIVYQQRASEPAPRVVYEAPARYYQQPTPTPVAIIGRDSRPASTAAPIEYRAARYQPLNDTRVGRDNPPRQTATLELISTDNAPPHPTDLRVSATRSGDIITLTVTGINRAGGFVPALAVADSVDGVPTVQLRNTPPTNEDGRPTPFTVSATLRIRGDADTLNLRIGDQLVRAAITQSGRPN